MDFLDKPTDPHLLYRKESKDGKLEIGVYPVMYGFRIRAGRTGQGTYELDYCAGSDLQMVETIYSIVLTVLSNKMNFSGFPYQEVKPMVNDPACLVKLVDMAKGLELAEVKTPEIFNMKKEYLEKVLSGLL